MNVQNGQNNPEPHRETIIHLLREKAHLQPDRTVYTFLPDGIQKGPSLDYQTLDRQAMAIAAQLQELKAVGERAILLYPPGLELIGAFFGCLYSQVIAIPGYLPDPTHLEPGLVRLQAVLQDGQVRFALTTSSVLKLLHNLAPQTFKASPVKWITTDDLPDGLENEWKETLPKPEDLAYLQYTSGSTHNPRGVCLTHANLIHNSRSISQAFSLTEDDITIIWLPAQHNMGLIGGVLQPFYSGMRCILMPPQVFLQQPLLWLQAISRFKATVSGGPNFAYDLCIHRISPDQCSGLDLSSWDLAFNGAEPVRAETMDRFSAAYTPFGFKKTAFFPCYGLAEATLMVTGGKRGMGPRTFRLDKKALGENRAALLPQSGPNAQTITGCGQSFRDQTLLVVNPEKCVPTAPGQIGELWISGPSVAGGYWNHPEETAETFHGHLEGSQDGPFLRTGDQGCFIDDECLIIGRIKDLIIIRGRNHYPQDIEKSVEHAHPAIIPGGCAAFSVEQNNTEMLVIVQEVDPRQQPSYPSICDSIRQIIFTQHDISARAVVLVEPFRIPKTISGKVQRQACRKLYLEGHLKPLHSSTITPEPIPPQKSDNPEPSKQGSLLHAALLALGPEKGRDLLITHLTGRVAELLSLPASSIDHDSPLTHLGLDSITAVELVQSIETSLGVSVSLTSIYQGASLTTLAKDLLSKLGKAQDTIPLSQIPLEPQIPVPVEEYEYPLTHGQKALWFVQRLNPDSAAHNIVYGALFREDTDLEILRKAFLHVIDRHPTLRTTFHEDNGQVVQRVHPVARLPFDLIDASGWTEQQIDQRISQEVLRPFDLQSGPLIRVTLLRQSANQVVLILALHHIVTDLWSMAVFLHELGQYYTGEVDGKLPELKPLSMQYADHVQWEGDMLAGPDGEKHWAYWKERLAGDLPVLHLPTDRPRPAVLSTHAAAHTFNLGVELTSGLKSACKTLDSNLFSTILAAFYSLLHRYTGQDDILIGTPKACRNRNNAGIIGYFINPVVIRADLSGRPTFGALLAQVHKNVQADFQHDLYPFPLLVERLHPRRELSIGPLFQIFYSWQKTNRLVDSRGITAFALGEENVKVDLSGLHLESYPLKDRVTPTDLALLVAESDDDLKMTVEYNVDLFDRETIQRLSGHLCAILSAVLADPHQPVAAIPMLSEAEKRQLLYEWNQAATTSALENQYLIHELIQRAALSCPDFPAVVFRDRTLTYQELIEHSRSLAACLHGAGVRPDSIVGVSLERSPEMVIALLGTLMAGAAFLPLDPDYPADRLSYMIADAGVAILLTQSWLADKLPAHSAQVICLDSEWAWIEEAAQQALNQGRGPDQVSLDNLAYLMYTSGSTGKPKGVLIEHRAIAQHCAFMREYYHLTAQDHVLQFASLNFDASLEQIFTCLMSGAALYLRDNDLWDPAHFSEKIAQFNLSVVNVPPAYWQQWVQADARKTTPISNPQLRLAIIGGDVVDPDILNLWRQVGRENVRLINAYGPTEAIITATAFDIPENSSQRFWRVPIGRPLAGRKALILDQDLQPVPVNVPGELHIGGTCLARGYVNQVELTHQKLIADPYDETRKGRLYKTGDLAHFLADGNIVFEGRVDRQIKVRGIRIEPGEIESVLRQHQAVQDGLVFLNEAETGPQLAACLVLKPGAKIELTQLIDFLNRLLPSYMLPSAIFTRDALPLTPSGKLDRQELAHSTRLELSAKAGSYVAPRNELERDLVCMWMQVLNLEQVGIYDDFFMLGGHSLLATQLISRIEETYPIEIPLRRLFESPTVAGLSLAITQALADGTEEQELTQILSELERESTGEEDGGKSKAQTGD